MATREITPSIDALITEALAMEAEEAKAAGALGFVARALAQATLPHRKVEGAHFERRNGDFTLTLLAPPRVGLPYGSVPRLLLAWLSTEAVKTKSRELVTMWGEEVELDVFERIVADKQKDGVVDETVVAKKVRGIMSEEFVLDGGRGRPIPKGRRVTKW